MLLRPTSEPAVRMGMAVVFIVMGAAFLYFVVIRGGGGGGALVARAWQSPLFALVSLATVVFGCALLVYELLGRHAPRVRLAAAEHPAVVGQPLLLRWRLHGPLDRVTGVSMRVQAIEQTRRTRTSAGGASTTDTTNVVVLELPAVPSAQADWGGGDAQVLIPADARPTDQDSRPALLWRIQVTTALRGWMPDRKDEFVLTVVDGRPGARKPR